MPLASLPTRHTRHPQILLRQTVQTNSCRQIRLHFTLLTTKIPNRFHSPKPRPPLLKRKFQFYFPIQILKRGHMGGHSHHNHEEHDIALLISKDASNPGVRITRIGLYRFPSQIIVDHFIVGL